MHLQEIGYGSVYWIDLAQGRDSSATCCERGTEPSCPVKCGEYLFHGKCNVDLNTSSRADAKYV